MKKAKKALLYIAASIIGLYILMIALVYFFQEKLLFHPKVLAKDYQFAFADKFDEVYVPVEEGVSLHGILFHAKESKGLVFYLHGNGGCVDGWGQAASLYNAMGYDVFMPDYRGYGKSGGHIESEIQLIEDVEKAYKQMLAMYDENKIIIAGYSIGTGPATVLASINNPKALLLQAPYSSLSMLIDEKVPLIPDFAKKYKFKSTSTIEKVRAPVYIFHGTQDVLIPYHHAEELIKHCSHPSKLITLEGEGHNAINESAVYASELEAILSRLQASFLFPALKQVADDKASNYPKGDT